jgi:hypothetical protein
MDDYSSAVISLVNYKSSALYFDYVIPATVGIQPDSAPLLERDLLRELLPPTLHDKRHFLDVLADLVFDLVYLQGRVKEALEKVNRPSWKEDFSDVRLYRQALADLAEEFHLTTAPIDASEEVVTNRSLLHSDIALSVTALPLIDVETASWELIREFRKDEDAKRRLRRLRLFVYKNYGGKSETYIEDDLATRLADYEGTAKKWGFTVRSAAYTALLDPQVVGLGVVGSAVSAYCHQPLESIAAAAVPALVAVGKLGIEIKKQSFVLREALRQNPVSYITMSGRS